MKSVMPEDLRSCVTCGAVISTGQKCFDCMTPSGRARVRRSAAKQRIISDLKDALYATRVLWPSRREPLVRHLLDAYKAAKDYKV